MTGPKEKLTGAEWRKNVIGFAGIVLLGIALYAHTLQVPWYLDDVRGIVENISVHRLSEALDNFFLSSRGISELTFALNHHFGGTNVAGYHLVNIVIHLLASCLALLLFKRIFRDRFMLALGAALVFVAHPLQTQAVTYVIQRTTSLAALFFFLAIYLYARAREGSPEGPARLRFFYGAALFCGALAVLIKQNTAVLPVALILFDRYFLARERPISWKRLLLLVAPFALVPVVLLAKDLLLPMFTDGSLADVGGLPNLLHLKNNSSMHYLVTEFSVIWIYLRLLFLPYGQALDYGYPIVANIWEWQNFLAFLGIAALLAAAVFLRKKLPFVAAGIFWFFLCLSVESTIIPLDPVFEHRLYLPMFGFALVVMAGFAKLSGRAALLGGVMLIGTLAVLTWQRNALWNDPIAFHEDNLRRAPLNERVYVDLANAYRKRGELVEAQRFYERALEINPDYELIHINLSLVYNAQKNYGKALAILLDGLRRSPSNFKLYNNLGVLYNVLGKYHEAVACLQKGLMLEPNNASLHFSLGLARERLGFLDEAIADYRRAIELESNRPESHFNLGMALFKKGARPEALQSFLTASRLDPEHVGAQYNAALLYLELGDVSAARKMAAKLRQLNPGIAEQLSGRIAQGQ